MGLSWHEQLFFTLSKRIQAPDRLSGIAVALLGPRSAALCRHRRSAGRAGAAKCLLGFFANWRGAECAADGIGVALEAPRERLAHGLEVIRFANRADRLDIEFAILSLARHASAQKPRG